MNRGGFLDKRLGPLRVSLDRHVQIKNNPSLPSLVRQSVMGPAVVVSGLQGLKSNSFLVWASFSAPWCWPRVHVVHSFMAALLCWAVATAPQIALLSWVWAIETSRGCTWVGWPGYVPDCTPVFDF